jgi:hypothetical protein
MTPGQPKCWKNQSAQQDIMLHPAAAVDGNCGALPGRAHPRVPEGRPIKEDAKGKDNSSSGTDGPR